MRVIALLALLFGFMGLLLLDGQVFTHAVFGIICGIAAVGSGLASARKDYSNEGRRWLGRILAILGAMLALFCVTRLPSAYRFQIRFNERSKKAREIMDATNRAEAEVAAVSVAGGAGAPAAACARTDGESTGAQMASTTRFELTQVITWMALFPFVPSAGCAQHPESKEPRVPTPLA